MGYQVQMAGFWPSSFFCDRVEVNKLAKKKNKQGRNQAIRTDQVWSITDLLYGFRGSFIFGGHSGWSQEERYRSTCIFPTWSVNHRAGLGSSCLLAELAIQ